MLFEALGPEAGQLIVLGRIADLNGTAADFTIFDVDLTRNGKIQNHRDFFATVRAHESMFHWYTGVKSKRLGEIPRSGWSLGMTSCLDRPLLGATAEERSLAHDGRSG
jgi:hypothetical protein